MTGDAAAFTLDHVIVFVRDLAAAERAFAERLGLVATSHATHPGFGTRNARIIFDSEHLEVLTEADAAELRSSRYGRVFVERHARRGDGPAVYVFRTPVFDDVVAAAKARGGEPGDRMIGYSRSDGVTRQWEAALMPGTEPVYLHPLLPTIGRGRPRPAWERGPHPIGATRIRGIVLATRDLDAAMALYRIQLGLEPARQVEHGGARVAHYALAQTGQHVVLAEPTEGGELARHLEQCGEGVFAVVLQVGSVEQAAAELGRRGTVIERLPWLPGLPVTPAETGLPVRLGLVPGVVEPA